MALIDSFGRKISYLRLSVTDRCNLRCVYCMPPEGVRKLRHEDILSYEELLLLAETAVSIGIEKIRVTGGEPLVRKGILGFLGNLSSIPGLRQLVLTTNGMLLPEMAGGLRSAGVQRLNISLDSLEVETFARITRGGDLNKVLQGIRIAEETGFPIKLNMVVMRGINDAEVVDFARLTLDKPHTVRFIEYMPTIKAPDWRAFVVPGEEIIRRIAGVYRLEKLERDDRLSGPSTDYRIDGAAGAIGIITPVSSHFCGDCNRIRVTSSGMARGCLFDDTEYDLKMILRNGNRAAIVDALREIVGRKPGRGRISDGVSARKPFDMSKVGG
ncbi:MAG TPA: GTP 3',8-cyclase MoaA [Geobacteraceae bacterium]|nr:GTP 3',8-cyclase MoaA [Geobacteraceae bacterium]